MDSFRVRIKRQDGPESAAYWQEFEIPYQTNMNVISVLQEIQKNPVTADGTRTSPVVWHSSCLEEVCGSCPMIINGRVAMACSALVDQFPKPLRLEPLKKFPVERDLAVDRSFMFNSLKRVKAWIPIDGTYDLGPGPRMPEHEREQAYELSKCITCGLCLEVCPQVNDHSPFMGAAIMSQVRLFNTHPTGRMNAHERLEAIMGEGGIQDCGMAQNCVKACPKEIPLVKSLGEMYRATTRYMFSRLFSR